MCEKHDCALVDFDLRGTEHRLILDIFIDNRQGVSLEHCTSVHRELLEEAETDKFLSDVYRLDVSSPGVDRPLKFNWQYDKNVGRLLSVKCSDGTTVTGTLSAVSDEEIELQPKTPKKQRVPEAPRRIPFDLITSSTVEIDFR